MKFFVAPAVRPSELHSGPLSRNGSHARLQTGPRPLGCPSHPGEVGRCVVVRGLKGSWIDLIEDFTDPDIRSFLKQPLLNDAINLRTNLRNQKGRCATRQFGGQDRPLLTDRYNGDLREGRGWSSLLRTATRCYQSGNENPRASNGFDSVIDFHECPCGFILFFFRLPLGSSGFQPARTSLHDQHRTQCR